VGAAVIEPVRLRKKRQRKNGERSTGESIALPCDNFHNELGKMIPFVSTWWSKPNYFPPKNFRKD
jgi:hypothetical protein